MVGRKTARTVIRAKVVCAERVNRAEGVRPPEVTVDQEHISRFRKALEAVPEDDHERLVAIVEAAANLHLRLHGLRREIRGDGD